jgi:hypothetical protein
MKFEQDDRKVKQLYITGDMQRIAQGGTALELEGNTCRMFAKKYELQLNKPSEGLTLGDLANA